MIPIWTQKFHSARIVENKATQYLYADYIYSDILNTMDLTTLSTIGRKYSAAKKTRIQNLQGSLQRKVSLALISLNMSTIKKIIKWTVLAVLIRKTISTESDIVMIQCSRCLSKELTLVLSDTRELDRVPSTE